MFLDAPKLKEFYDVYDTEPEVRDGPDSIDAGRVRGMVEFNKVSFSHDGVRPAVADLAFTAMPGETVALVGPTGAGKSTALALLYRVFDPQSGAVKIDGMDIRGLLGEPPAISAWYSKVLLFNPHHRGEFAYRQRDATDQNCAACKRAQAFDFIDKPEGMLCRASAARSRARAVSASVPDRARFAGKIGILISTGDSAPTPRPK